MPVGAVPNLSKDEATERARLCDKAGDKAGAARYSDIATHLGAGEARAKITPSAHQTAQQQHGQLRRLEKQLETELARVL
eukprot:3491756-Pyramimonas_sp.AAC.1